MSVMFEVWYARPRDSQREARVTAQVCALGGRLDYWEESESPSNICLTYEFDDWGEAEHAATLLRQHGEYVHGPHEYGD